MLIRIKSYLFELPEPFREGTVLTLGEAQALNGLYAENIRNNMAKVLGQLTATLAEGELLSPSQVAEMQDQITAYARKYQFVARHSPARQRGEIADAASAIGMERAEAQARASGRDTSSPDVASLAAQLAQLPEVQEEARERVRVRHQVASSSLAELLGL